MNIMSSVEVKNLFASAGVVVSTLKFLNFSKSYLVDGAPSDIYYLPDGGYSPGSVKENTFYFGNVQLHVRCDQNSFGQVVFNNDYSSFTVPPTGIMRPYPGGAKENRIHFGGQPGGSGVIAYTHVPVHLYDMAFVNFQIFNDSPGTDFYVSFNFTGWEVTLSH